jgi:hypothetical protein
MSDPGLRLVGAFVFLLAGLALLLVVVHAVYPRLKWAHERAKVTGSQGIDPGWYVDAARAVFLALLPLIGFAIGPALFSRWFA